MPSDNKPSEAERKLSPIFGFYKIRKIIDKGNYEKLKSHVSPNLMTQGTFSGAPPAQEDHVM